jgi:uncharacterized membrane protein
MIRPSLVLAGWGAMLTLLGVVLLGFSPPQYIWALLVGAALALLPIGAVLLIPGARPDAEPRALPETSLATVAVAAGLAVIALGIAAGAWLVAVGAEITLLALFFLVREVRAQRRERRR